MSYITGLSSIEKGQRGELFFDKNQFLFATDFTDDPYFEDELNWKRIALHFKDPTNGQTQIIILKDDGARGWFAPSETCRTGIWEIEFIEIYDKQGDLFRVERTNMPSPGDFDVDVQRKVAPASLVSVVVAESNVVSNSTFDSDLSGWVDIGSGASWNASGHANYLYDSDLGLSYTAATDIGKRYIMSYRQVDVQGIVNLQLHAEIRESVGDTGTWGAGAGRVVNATNDSANGQTFELEAVASQANTLLVLGAGGNSGTVQFDDVTFTAVPDKVVLDSGEAAHWRVGFKCRIWDDIASQYLTNDVYEITDITGDQITLDQQLIGDYEGKTLRLRFPDYNDASGVQASLYQYVSQGY